MTGLSNSCGSDEAQVLVEQNTFDGAGAFMRLQVMCGNDITIAHRAAQNSFVNSGHRAWERYGDK